MARFFHYGVRLTKKQLDYLKTQSQASAFIREAIDEKIKREKLKAKDD